MKKNFFLLPLVVITAQLASAQTTNIVGTIKDEKGNPLHYVFVGNIHDKNATYTDSLGNFTIVAGPGTKLDVDLRGFEPTVITVNKADDSPQVTLKSTGSLTAGKSVNSITGGDSTTERPSNINLDRLPGHEKGHTRGSKYLLDIFAHGFFVNSSDQLIYNRDYVYNYDKKGGGVLVTKDGKSILELGYDQTKSITFFTSKDEVLVFEKLPSVDLSHYLQVLATGKKYKIYKLIKTRLVKADYVNNGVTQHGNDYDEYIDDADYYVVDVQSMLPKKLSLKKKSIKEDFAKDADKVNKYLSDKSGDIDDAYLSKLGDYMNQ